MISKLQTMHITFQNNWPGLVMGLVRAEHRTEWIDFILNIPTGVIGPCLQGWYPPTTPATNSDQKAKAVGLQIQATTSLPRWWLPLYHTSCLSAGVVAEEIGLSLPLSIMSITVDAGNGTGRSLSSDMADQDIPRKGKKKATGNVKHQGYWSISEFHWFHVTQRMSK